MAFCRLAVYKVGHNGEQNLVANMSNPVEPSFTVTGLHPGSHYQGEVSGYNIKGIGVPITIRAYTIKLPENLKPSIAAEPNPREFYSNIVGPLVVCLK